MASQKKDSKKSAPKHKELGPLSTKKSHTHQMPEKKSSKHRVAQDVEKITQTQSKTKEEKAPKPATREEIFSPSGLWFQNFEGLPPIPAPPTTKIPDPKLVLEKKRKGQFAFEQMVYDFNEGLSQDLDSSCSFLFRTR